MVGDYDCPDTNSGQDVMRTADSGATWQAEGGASGDATLASVLCLPGTAYCIAIGGAQYSPGSSSERPAIAVSDDGGATWDGLSVQLRAAPRGRSGACQQWASQSLTAVACLRSWRLPRRQQQLVRATPRTDCSAGVAERDKCVVRRHHAVRSAALRTPAWLGLWARLGRETSPPPLPTSRLRASRLIVAWR